MQSNKLNYRVIPQVVQYEGTAVRRQFEFADIKRRANSAGQHCLSAAGSDWQCDYQLSGVAGRPEAVDMTVTFSVKKGNIWEAGIRLCFEFKGCSQDDYVVIPGAVYDGNRFACRPSAYPPLFDDPSEHRLDMPTTVTDIPRLGNGSGPFKIEQTTGDASTPAMGFYDVRRLTGCWILTEQQNDLGNLGLFIEESSDHQTRCLSVVSPCVRTHRHEICARVNSFDRGRNWKTGDMLTLRVRIFLFEAAAKTDFLSYFTDIRREIVGDGTLCTELPFSAAWQILEDKYNRDNWCDQRSYYSVGTRETINLDWQIGWVGGCMVTQPLLFCGSAVSRQRALKNLDVVLSKTQSPSGFFYGMGNGKTWFSDGFFGPHPANMHLIRKNGDALYFLLKQFITLRTSNRAEQVYSHWDAALRRLADAFVLLWKKFGQFGQFIDIETGNLLVGGSASGAIVPAGLALAARYYKNPVYMQIAEEAAVFYLEQFRKNGVTTGGPGEILQAPDSESAFALLESLVVLYEETGQHRWIQGAQDAAALCMSWCVSYDYCFPPDSLFAKLNIRTTGAVYANAQNKHAAPAICTLSGDSLLKLYRATGNESYLKQLCAIARNLPQYISRTDRPIGTLLPGWINERVNMSDWEGSEMVGEILHFSAWPEVSCMLTWQEVPGLYVRPDIGTFCCIDNIDVKVRRQSPLSLQLELHNPTRFHASVRTLIETEQDLKKPLGIAAVLGCPCISLAPEETKSVLFTGQTVLPAQRATRPIYNIAAPVAEKTGCALKTP